MVNSKCITTHTIWEKTGIKETNIKIINTIKMQVHFCEKWDQASFDPNFKSMTLDEFAPMVKEYFLENHILYFKKRNKLLFRIL